MSPRQEPPYYKYEDCKYDVVIRRGENGVHELELMAYRGRSEKEANRKREQAEAIISAVEKWRGETRAEVSSITQLPGDPPMYMIVTKAMQ